MLGLRPQLRARPSLLDLIRKPDIDRISTAAEGVPALNNDVQAHRIPLPASPQIGPQRKDSDQPALPTPLIKVHLHESSDEEDKEEQVVKMPAAVSLALVKREPSKTTNAWGIERLKGRE